MDQKIFKVTNQTTGQCIVECCRKADRLFTRFMGLMGTPSLGRHEALWITPCNSVHSFFMRYSIDVIYMDAKGTVLDIVYAMPPWRVHMPRAGARAALELAAGVAAAAAIKKGDSLCLS